MSQLMSRPSYSLWRTTSSPSFPSSLPHYHHYCRDNSLQCDPCSCTCSIFSHTPCCDLFLPCTIALLLNEFAHPAHKESHGLIINITSIFILTWFFFFGLALILGWWASLECYTLLLLVFILLLFLINPFPFYMVCLCVITSPSTWLGVSCFNPPLMMINLNVLNLGGKHIKNRWEISSSLIFSPKTFKPLTIT